MECNEINVDNVVATLVNYNTDEKYMDTYNCKFNKPFSRDNYLNNLNVEFDINYNIVNMISQTFVDFMDN